MEQRNPVVNATMRDALAELIDFAALGGWHWREPSGAAFAFMTGDPDDVCTYEDGKYVIRKHERGMVSKPLIAAAELGHIEKYLSFHYGNTVRRKSGLPDIWLPGEHPAEVGESRSDYSFGGTPANMLVSWKDSSGHHEVNLNYLSAGDWAQYSRHSAQEIRDSFLHPEGLPVFTPSPQRTSLR